MRSTLFGLLIAGVALATFADHADARRNRRCRNKCYTYSSCYKPCYTYNSCRTSSCTPSCTTNVCGTNSCTTSSSCYKSSCTTSSSCYKSSCSTSACTKCNSCESKASACKTGCTGCSACQKDAHGDKAHHDHKGDHHKGYDEGAEMKVREDAPAPKADAKPAKPAKGKGLQRRHP